MRETKTYELTISFPQEGNRGEEALLCKEEVISCLRALGEESFVEGAIDNIEVDYDYDRTYEEQYLAMGGPLSPIVLYKYSAERLGQIAACLAERFGSRIALSHGALDTDKWLHGWKENFKPFTTRRFQVHPPWIAVPPQVGLLPLVIEPGVAFGTGHHDTTRLCLAALEDQLENVVASPNTSSTSLLDVGTGTGILAIAAAKGGMHPVWATDIDIDAVGAVRENARVNGVHLEVREGSIPFEGGPWDVVVANILAVVLRKILPQLAAALKPKGRLILSGLLVEDRAEFEALAMKHALTLRAFREESGWAMLLFVAP